MRIIKKYFKKLLFCLMFLSISIAGAQEISEIMYDPKEGSEWIEVYNNTDSSLDLTTYKFYDPSTKHSISSASNYSNPNLNMLKVGEYAVIANDPVTFLSANPGFSGNLFDSVFSLTDTGKQLILKNSSLANVFSISYMPQVGANNTGASLNYLDGILKVYMATPGASSTLITVSSTNGDSGSGANSTTTNSTTTSNTTNTSSGSGASMGSYAAYSSSGSNRFTLGDLRLLVPREINTVVGAETEFFVKNIDNKNSIVNAQTYWSFGDGAEGIGTTTTHRYQNVGVYNAFIESEVSNSYGVDRIIVKVENPNIEISDVQDNYVELYNKSDIELNIGRFIIASDQGLFQLSRMFIINANSKVKVDGRVLGFSKLTNVKLMSAYNTFVTKYENKNMQNMSNQVSLSNISSTSTLSVLQNASSATQIKNKIIYKKPFKVVSKGLAPKKNPSLLIMGTTTKVEEKLEESGEKGSTNFAKKWLYWLYE